MAKKSRCYIGQIRDIVFTSFNFDGSMSVKIDIMRNMFLQAILDLAEEALFSYKRNKLIPAAIIARSLFERTALLSYLFYSIKECIEQYNKESIGKLKKILFGSRGKYVEIESIHINTVVKKVIKEDFENSEVEWLYDALSNLVHPNYDGVWNTYFNVDMKTMKSHGKSNIGLTIVTAVSTSLGLSIIRNKSLSELLPQFAAAEGMNCVIHRHRFN